MKILHLSTSDIDNGGARAAYRLHEGLRSVGVDSTMLVRAKFSVNSTVTAEPSLLTKLAPRLSGLPMRFYPSIRQTIFSTQWVWDVLARQVSCLKPDVIHLHWICNGFVKIETLAQLRVPLVWTLHDMWPFTGGCHYTGDCTRYTDRCGACPYLASQTDLDLSRWVWQRKAHAWNGLDLTIVSPSHWLADCAHASSLFKALPIRVIPHGLDLKHYKPISPAIARDLLGLPHHQKLVLFGASPGTTSHERKGFHLLRSALQLLSKTEWGETIELVIFGASQPNPPFDVGMKTHYVGSLRDDISLALVYSAADVIVVPSLQEAFGLTAAESLACGTPVVAFAATGLRDIVNHQQNGYLAQPFEVQDLATGLIWVLEDADRHDKLCTNARSKAEQEYSSALQVQRHLDLYDRILHLAKCA